MNSSPKVSVLIPTYNYACFLDETIQSVLDQTFTDFELIIVDNCSTDQTDEVVKKYLTDRRVSYYKNETNIGLVGNWNKCLEYSRGEYIKFLCADDKFYPQLLERFVALMDQHTNVAIISSFNEAFGSNSFCRIHPFKGLLSGETARKKLIEKGNWIFAPSAAMFRKENCLKVGKFNAQLLLSTDYEYYLRLLTTGDCYVIPECLSFTRLHPSTQSAIGAKKKYDISFERYRFMKIVKMSGTQNIDTENKDGAQSLIDQEIKRRAIRCAAIMYEVLPKLHKKESRIRFKKAFQIGYSEGVLFTPIIFYLGVLLKTQLPFSAE